MDFHIWLTFLAASALLLLIPGPTVLMVLSYALSKERSVAVASAAGVATGDFLALSLSLAGLGALVTASALLFTVLKWVGAGYLVYMGVRLILSAPTRGLHMPRARVTPRGVYWHAATVTALNPKSIAFFIAFVPQFVDQGAPLLPQFAILVSSFVTLATLNALAFALAADRLRSVIGQAHVIDWLTRTGGAALIGMGVLTATLRRG